MGRSSAAPLHFRKNRGKKRGGDETQRSPRPFEAQGKQSAAATGAGDRGEVRYSDLADSFRPALIRRAKPSTCTARNKRARYV